MNHQKRFFPHRCLYCNDRGHTKTVTAKSDRERREKNNLNPQFYQLYDTNGVRERNTATSANSASNANNYQYKLNFSNNGNNKNEAEDGTAFQTASPRRAPLNKIYETKAKAVPIPNINPFQPLTTEEEDEQEEEEATATSSTEEKATTA